MAINISLEKEVKAKNTNATENNRLFFSGSNNVRIMLGMSKNSSRPIGHMQSIFATRDPVQSPITRRCTMLTHTLYDTPDISVEVAVEMTL